MAVDTKMRYSGIQDDLDICGNEGCHFLTLLSIAEESIDKPIDLIDAIHSTRVKNLITDDFYVNSNCKFLNELTGKKWTQREVTSLPKVIKDNEYTEAIWYNPNTKKEHYRRRGFDTKKNSRTVREGYIRVYRIYKWS